MIENENVSVIVWLNAKYKAINESGIPWFTFIITFVRVRACNLIR
jgi:hypothetical protein